MTKKTYIFLFAFVLLLSVNSYGINETYCVKPPFIQTYTPVNIMLVLDYSGSMNWSAYSGNYDSSKIYYGYFNPKDTYSQDSNGVWYIGSNGENPTSGSQLNYKYMDRIDILRWILTGGDVLGGCINVYSCDSYWTQSSCDANPLCEWGQWLFWGWCENKSYCNSLNKQECENNELCQYGKPVVITNDGIEIKLQDVSSYDPSKGKVIGILQKIRDQAQRPRIGSVFFSGYVFKRIKLSNQYTQLIDAINNTAPNGATCTKCALDEMYYLFSENSDAIQYYGNPYEWGTEHKVVRCTKNFNLVMSDGEWNTPDETTKSDPIRPINMMWEGGSADLVSAMEGLQNARTYSVAMFQNPDSEGTNALKWMAVYGNYDDLNGNGYPCNEYEYPNTSLTVTENLEKHCSEVKENYNKNGPYGYFKGNNPQELKTAITSAFNEILKQASSGTATSILSKKERANMGILQAAFYPKKILSNGYTLSWAGSLYNWWFYMSSSGQSFKSNIREDTIKNKDLDICSNGVPGGDYIMNYNFEDSKLKIKAYKSLCTGDNATSTPAVIYSGLDKAHPVWEAGSVLAKENPMDRTIYTYVGNTQPASPQNPIQLKNVVNTKDHIYSKLFGDENGDGVIDGSGENYTYAKAITLSNLEDYIYGEDIEGYRKRTIDSSGDVWKLGDIIYSTPRTVDYDNYTVTFVGANDGMLHAFLVGKYRYDNLGAYQMVKLRDKITGENTSELGKELWAFIPKNSLPYLRFLSDPDYCHLYYIDLTPSIIELKDSSGNIYKRILIGGMRLGGAVGCDNSSVCINPPKDTCDNVTAYAPGKDPANSSNYCLGLSSYFALDITNPIQPKFLWEFTDKDLGFSYSGPAFIKRTLADGSNAYYVMFASGPTDYDGDSGQKLRLFILRLNNNFTISSTYKINISDKLGIGNAFGGSMSTYGITDSNGYTKDVFFGISYNNNGIWNGNVIGIKPNSDNPENWTFFKLFVNPIGPVTVPISYGECSVNGVNKGFLYFGTGRYFFKNDDPGTSNSDIDKLYGVNINSCINSVGDTNCTVNNKADLYPSSETCSQLDNSVYGWYQDLDPKEQSYNKERDITGTTLSSMNAVFFTTTEPTSNICGFGGRSRMWGLNCATGESLTNQTCNTTNSVVGTLLLQTSVGQIAKFDISINPSKTQGNKNPFTQKNGKATNWIVGTASPNKSALIEKPKMNPIDILYEIEK